MKHLESNHFGRVDNSMFSAVFLKQDDKRREDFRVNLPGEKSMDNLSHVSLLYVYTNPPPAGTGAPSPKIAETVLRANSYNRNPEYCRYRNIGRYQISRNRWVGLTEEGDPIRFPLGEIHGNFHPRKACDSMDDFIHRYREAIDSTVVSTIEKYLNMNPDILTKANQTWCPLTRSSIPSATAYKNAMDFFEENLGSQPRTMIEMIQYIHRLANCESIKGFEFYEERREVRERTGPLRIVKTYVKTVIKKRPKQYTGKEKDDYLIELFTSFCGYLKLGERGKKNKRAIASPNMFLRVYLEIIEAVHLELGKVIESSTISIGGDEKKNRIQAVLMSLKSNLYASHSCQATQDATKWNECLSPELFALFAACLYERRLGKTADDTQRLFYEICKEGHMFLALKRISLGQMPICMSKEHYNRPRLSKENLHRFNKETREWMEKCLPFMDNGYLRAPNGMLMGMHNALSTTVALSASVRERGSDTRRILRSSDDSTTVYVCSTNDGLRESLQADIKNHKFLGVNFSVEKTLLFPEGFGEYTSWYFDGKFLAQYGTDTSQLRPGGRNPYDDLNSMMRQTAVSQVRLECNPFGAAARIQLSAANVRRLYRIHIRTERRSPQISLEVTLFADGGVNPYVPSNCHLDEIAMKGAKAMNEEEQTYINKICTIDNPFCSTIEEDVTWSKDRGELVFQTIETPRNLFTFQRRRNRTLNSEKGKAQAETEKSNNEAMKIMQLSDPSIYIVTPNSGEMCSTKVINEMRVLRDSVSLTEGEKAQVEKAIDRLLGIEEEYFPLMDDGDNSDVDLIDD